jgi:hypothetical protein
MVRSSCCEGGFWSPLSPWLLEHGLALGSVDVEVENDSTGVLIVSFFRGRVCLCYFERRIILCSAGACSRCCRSRVKMPLGRVCAVMGFNQLPA